MSAQIEELIWAERAVMAACLDDSEVVNDLHVEPKVFTGERRVVMDAIATMMIAGKAIDRVTVGAYLADRNLSAELELGYQEAEKGRAASYYPLILADYVARNSRAIGQDIANGANPAEMITKLEALSRFGEGPGTSAMKPLAHFQRELVDMLEGKTETLIKTGLPSLDDCIGGGMGLGNLVIIGARPGVGKTALGVNIALNAGVPTAIFSGEQKGRELAGRIMAQTAKIHAEKLRGPKSFDKSDWPKVISSLEQHNSGLVTMDDTASPTLSHIVTETRRAVRNFGTKLVVVDYIQRMKMPGKNRVEEIEAVAQGLKTLAAELNIVVVCLSQLNRGAVERLPRSSDLKGSGGIEQEADLVILIHRDDVLNPQNKEALLMVDKNRHGAPANVQVNYHGEYLRFSSKARF